MFQSSINQKNHLRMNDQSLYCKDLFNYQRFPTQEVSIGKLKVGENQAIAIQSMTNTSTMDTEASIQQAIRIFDAGADLVRLTAQGIREAENLRLIRNGLTERGYNGPLSADIHFNPNAAEVAARYVEKVRINPGNFVDAGRTFRQIHYTDESYRQEIEKIRTRLLPLLSICKTHHTALRIGVNHGSLSDRIMSRYGNSPEGMVESCMEFLRICREVDFNDVVISIKASNTLMMVQTVRLFVKTMQEEGMNYPLHLGVTEAGDGEDGRIKSAVGIGALLIDGIGDTIRVSLSEDPENEIPVAKKLVQYVQQRWHHPRIDGQVDAAFNPYQYQRRNTLSVGKMGGHYPPIVFAAKTDMYHLQPDEWLSDHPPLSVSEWKTLRHRRDGWFLVKLQWSELTEELIQLFNESDNVVILLSSTHVNATGEMRAVFHSLMSHHCETPVIIHRTYNEADVETFQIQASVDVGSLLLDGFGDGVLLENEALPASLVVDTAFGILQAARVRISKTEYISCPGCGRTMFDLQTTLARVKEATKELVGLKIGVMGCVVNGPGEMADADFGYVGAAKGKVSLYHHHHCIEKNIPEEDAVRKLLDYIHQSSEFFYKQFEPLFYFHHPNVALFEIKRLDVPETTSAAERYQWFWASEVTHEVTPLTFRSMINENEHHERVFEEGKLRFNEKEAQWISIDGTELSFLRHEHLALEDWMLQPVSDFFRKK
jgi:(E)-4-hydroxy-3-methylbut-2-enyl-diphosphate synthase